MLLLPIPTPILKPGDDLAKILHDAGMIEPGDIIVISSKAVATVEGAAVELSRIKPGKQAEKLSKTCRQDPHYTQAVLDETKRMNGSVVGTCPWALLTSLKPKGMKHGRILCPNAGLDQSNVKKGCAMGWPVEPVRSVGRLREELERVMVPRWPKGPRLPRWSAEQSRSNTSVPSDTSVPSVTSPHIPSNPSRLALILSDSCCRPGRLGVVAFALACAGIDPVKSEVGTKDIFGKALRFTNEAIADQLATAANAVMGNAGQSTPAAIIRDHGLQLSEFCGWVAGIEAKEDLFRDVLKS